MIKWKKKSGVVGEKEMEGEKGMRKWGMGVLVDGGVEYGMDGGKKKEVGEGVGVVCVGNSYGEKGLGDLGV